MFLDAIGPIESNKIDYDNLLFVIIGIVIILCILSIILFLKVRGKKNEKN